MVKSTSLSRLALIACVIALCAIALGSFTRLVDAGLGCPDWPACYGHLIPTGSSSSLFVGYKAWSEMIHRYVAGSLSIAIVIIIGMLLAKKNRVLAGILLGLVVYQIILGAWTVTLKLLPIIVTQHLIGGFAILSVAWWIYLTYSEKDRTPAQPVPRWVLYATRLGILLLIIQIILGAWTSTHYAALSCPDFPFCKAGQSISFHSMREAFSVWTPIGVNYQGGVLSEGARQMIQMAHRCAALTLTGYILLLTLCAQSVWQSSFVFLKSMVLMWGVLCLQLSIGLINVLLKLPLLTAVLHTVFAALLLLSLLTLVFYLSRDIQHV